MTKLEPSDLKGPAENGVYLHGLWLDGASWSKKEGRMEDAKQKVRSSLHLLVHYHHFMYGEGTGRYVRAWGRYGKGWEGTSSYLPHTFPYGRASCLLNLVA